MTADVSNLAGFLYRVSDEESMRQIFSRMRDVGSWETIVEGEWFSFVWKASHEEVTFILRDGKDRFLLLSQDQAHVASFLAVCGIENRLDRPRVLISAFVKDLIAPVNDARLAVAGRQYRISNVFAAIDSYGRSLKTIALWGDDLLNAELAITLLNQISPYRVTVRDLIRDSDIASVGSNGEVNFFFRGVSHLRKIDSFFRFLKRQGYIRWAGSTEPPVES
jgi:hypothetical protein